MKLRVRYSLGCFVGKIGSAVGYKQGSFGVMGKLFIIFSSSAILEH